MCLHSEMCSINARTSQANTPSIKAEIPWTTGKAGRTSPKRKKPRRVLYPAVVRKYLPREKKDPIKRWLAILCLVVFLQIFFEDASQCDNEPFTNVPTDDVRDELMENSSLPLEMKSSMAGMMAEQPSQQPSNGQNSTIQLHMRPSLAGMMAEQSSQQPSSVQNSTFPLDTESSLTGILSEDPSQRPLNGSQTYVIFFPSEYPEDRNSTFFRDKDEHERYKDKHNVQY